MERIMATVLSVSMLAALSACSSDNNNDTPIEDPPRDVVVMDREESEEPDNSVPFTTIGAIRPSTEVRFVGSSQELTATRNASGVVTTVSNPTDFGLSGASARLTYDENGELAGLTARSAEDTEVTFTESEIEQPRGMSLYTVEKDDESAVGVAANASRLGWDYQSFMSLIIGPNSSESESEVVVQTVGAITLPTRIPSTGTAGYEGLSAGVYTDSSGSVFQTVSDVEAIADFAAGRVTFETTGTMVDDISTPPSNAPEPDLDIRGTLDYNAGTNHFDGDVRTTGGQSGAAHGRFYGPEVEEVGGTFATRGEGAEAYIGAFGAANDNSVAFTSVGAIRRSTEVRFMGSSQELTATTMAATDTMPARVTAVSDPTDFESGASARLTYDENVDLAGLTARSAEGTRVTFTGSEIAQPGQLGFYTGVGGSAYGIAASGRSSALSWEYQSFGSWIIAEANRLPVGVVAQTVGVITSPSAIPPNGTGSYVGRSTGVYINSGGSVFQTVSDVGAEVDFGRNTIDFSTTDTMVDSRSTPGPLRDVQASSLRPESGLDITGTLVSTGPNHFAGTVSTMGGASVPSISGMAHSRFYGPAAEEIGGTFATKGTGSEAYIGAFGAQR